jgi:anti-sigma factor RsiW
VNRKVEISDIELGALIDGELDTARAGEIEAALREDIALLERLHAFRSDKAMLKKIYGPVGERPLPREWQARIQGRRSRMVWFTACGAIAAAIVIAVAVGAYWKPGPAAEREIVQVALAARGDASGGKIVAVSGDVNIHAYDAALKRATALDLRVPNLARMGYHLAAIHLYDGAAELLYRDGDNRLFTLYLRHSDGAARFDQFDRDGLRICVWQDDRLSTVMAGNVSAPAMQRLASLSYTGLTL